MGVVDQRLVEKWLGSGRLPPRCPYLKGKGSSYYCLVGDAGLQYLDDVGPCPDAVASGDVYACEVSMFVSRYHRLLNERVKV